MPSSGTETPDHVHDTPRKDAALSVFCTAEEAVQSALQIGCSGYHEHDHGKLFMPCHQHADAEELLGPFPDLRGVHCTKEAALAHAQQLGCTGTHTTQDKYMPCSDHATFEKLNARADDERCVFKTTCLDALMTACGYDLDDQGHRNKVRKAATKNCENHNNDKSDCLTNNDRIRLPSCSHTLGYTCPDGRDYCSWIAN